MEKEALNARILVVDDVPTVRKLLVRTLRQNVGYEVVEASRGDEAQKILGGTPFDLVITDLQMPGIGGLELMEWAQAHEIQPAWIIISGYGTFEAAVRAIQLGAFDFLSKPLESSAQLQIRVRNAILQKKFDEERELLNEELTQANRSLRDRVGQLETACQLLGDQARIIQEDLHRAERIQHALLPHAMPKVPGFAVSVLYHPSQNIGGDLYDVVPCGEGCMAFTIADAAGHGVSAAMLSVLFKTHLQQLMAGDEPKAPQIVLERLNELFVEECGGSAGLFVTAAYGLVDLRRNEIRYASAGHPPPIIHRADGSIEKLFVTGPALGLSPQAKIAEVRASFLPGDQLLCYTDGLLDRWSCDERSASDRISSLLKALRGRQGDPLSLLLEDAHAEREDRPSSDDITLMLIRRDDEPSVFDIHEATENVALSKECEAMEPSVLVGEFDEGTVFSVRGRGTWTACTTFYERARSELEAGHGLWIDLRSCTYLDSTFFGTIHEVVIQAEGHGVPVRLQGVSERILDELKELGMEQVIQHLDPERMALPEGMFPLQQSQRNQSADYKRLLSAHEALAGLSEQNQAAFLHLIEGLRQEERAVSRNHAKIQ